MYSDLFAYPEECVIKDPSLRDKGPISDYIDIDCAWEDAQCRKVTSCEQDFGILWLSLVGLIMTILISAVVMVAISVGQKKKQ